MLFVHIDITYVHMLCFGACASHISFKLSICHDNFISIANIRQKSQAKHPLSTAQQAMPVEISADSASTILNYLLVVMIGFDTGRTARVFGKITKTHLKITFKKFPVVVAGVVVAVVRCS